MRVGRGIRLNLSTHKGMNCQNYVHAANKCAKLINLRPTDNGPETRNPAETVLSTIGSRTIKDSEQMTETGERILWLADSNGVPKMQMSEWFPFGTVSNIWDTPYKNTFVFNDGSTGNSVGTLSPNIKVLFKQTTAPTGTHVDQSLSVYEYNPDLRTVMNGLLCQRDYYWVPPYGTLSWTRAVAVITVTATAHNLVTGMSITVASSDTSAIPNGAYTITVTGANTFTFTGVAAGGASGTLTLTYSATSPVASSQTVVYEPDKYTTVNPVSLAPIPFSRGFTLYETSGSGKAVGGYSPYPHTKTLANDFSSNTCTGRSNSQYRYPSGQYARVNLPGGAVTSYNFGGGITVFSIKTFGGVSGGDWTSVPGLSGEIWAACSSDNKVTIFINNTVYLSLAISDFSGATLIDVAPIYYNPDSNRAMLLCFYINNSGGYKVDELIFDTSANPWVLKERNNVITDASGYIGLAAQLQGVNAGNFREFRFSLFSNSGVAIYQTASVFSAVSGNTTALILANVQQVVFLNAKDCYLSAGNIIDVAYEWDSFQIPMNNNPSIGIRPFFGYATQTDQISSPESSYWMIPVMQDYDGPINNTSGQKITHHPMSGYNPGTEYRFRHWCFYAFTPPPTETQVLYMRMAKGVTDTAGSLHLYAYADTGSEEAGFVTKQFPTVFGPDNVIIQTYGVFTDVVRYSEYSPFSVVEYGGTTGHGTLTHPTATRSDGSSGQAMQLAANTANYDLAVQTERNILLWKIKPPNITNRYRLLFQCKVDTANCKVQAMVWNYRSGTGITPYDYNGLGWGTGSYVNSGNYLTANTWYTFDGKFSIDNSDNTASKSDTPNQENFTIRFDLEGPASAVNLVIMDVVLMEYMDGVQDLFRSEIAYRTTDQEQFQMVACRLGGYYSVILDSKTAAAYFTAAGFMYVNRSKAHYLPYAPVAITETGFGYVLACDNETYLLQGLTYPMPRIQMLPFGLNSADKYALQGTKGYAALFNDSSVYLITAEGMTPIGEEITPFINSATWTGRRFVAIDSSQNEVWIPVIASATGAITITDGTNTVTNDVAFAVYDLDDKGWRIYAYTSVNGNTASNNAVLYSKNKRRVVLDGGGRMIVGEIMDSDAIDSNWTSESWDIPVMKYATRDASLENIGWLKKLSWLSLETLTRRDIADNANVNLVDIKIYEGYNPLRPSNNLKAQIPLRNVTMNSWSVPININVFSAACEITMVRYGSTQNPKVILKDLIYRVIDKSIKREGGW